MTYRQEAEKVLAEWREIERALDEAEPGSDGAEELRALASRLREDYAALVGRAEVAHAQDESPPSILEGGRLPDPTG
jgi:hypothetical protein